MVYGQTVGSPQIHLEVWGSAVTDTLSNADVPFDSTLSRVTNFNPSVRLSDTVLSFLYDSLRNEKVATIVTVYETDEDSVVGLWEMGQGSNRALWLNSQRVSYEGLSIRYRKSTEKGVVIHTMQYCFPQSDNVYDGHDTLYLGKEGVHIGEKNFCALYYYAGRLGRPQQRVLESALAVRYGALLHGAYLNSRSDTLWNSLGNDSLYSFGICGIGRDDSLSLNQPRSVIRGDLLTMESARPQEDLEHVLMGCDDGAPSLGGKTVVYDSVPYVSISRRWKLRAHTSGGTSLVRFGARLPHPAASVRLLLSTDDGDTLYTPSATDSVVFENVAVFSGRDYYITLLVDPASVSKDSRNGRNGDGASTQPPASAFNVQVLPNPCLGKFTVSVNQSDEDIVSIRVVDANGRDIDIHTSTEKVSQYRYQGILTADGAYYVIVGSNGQQKTIKLIVKK